MLLCYHSIMAKLTSDNTTPRWKRSAVKGTLIGVRLQPFHLKALDAWIAKQKPPVTRPEAIRGMIETILHIFSKDTGEKASRAKGK
jgi:hypothetical protein